MDDVLFKCDRWLEREGPRDNVVVSTRARYARNFPKVPFPRRAHERDLRAVLDRVAEAIDHAPDFAGGLRFYMSDVPEIVRQYLRESHLISAEMEKAFRHRALFLSAHLRLGVMVNEEDHLRMYALEPGLRPYEALQQVIDLESGLARELPFAFSPRFGYLTSCTTNTGTGLRVSAMLHLPALSITRQIQSIVESLHARGMTARGFYGENTENHGAFFQISNEVTLGKDEREIVAMFIQVIQQIVDREEHARRELYDQNKAQIEDRIWRAYGILTHARLVSSTEAMELLALLRLGIDYGLLAHLSHGQLNKLAVEIQPHHVRAALLAAERRGEDTEFSEEERDRARAALVRQRLLASPDSQDRR